jgi:uncharacterized membrane protein YqiK
MLVAVLVIGGATLVAIMLLVGLFRAMWRVAEPNEALIISGARHRAVGVDESMGFRIITGRGTLVMPGVQVVRKLSLDLNEADLGVDCVTQQGIPVRVRGVVIFKVGDDFASIANSARRFLDQQPQIANRVHNVFAGHLRSIVGGLTVEDMIRDREKLTQQTRAASGTEMEKLGLIIDSLQIHEIEDPTGYIKNLALPHTAEVTKHARIAQAKADREAAEAEAEAAARKAEAIRTSRIQQAGYQAEIDRAQAEAAQAGPLAQATAQQQVVVAETRAAELSAGLAEKRLESEVRKPADANAYQQRTLAEAGRDARISAAEAGARETELRADAEAIRVRRAADAEAAATTARAEADARSTEVNGLASAKATEANGLAEAAAVRARALAEAEGIQARAKALAENQEAVIAQQIAEQYPAIVDAAAQSIAGVDRIVMLNGADGMEDLLAKVMTMGGAGLGIAGDLVASLREPRTQKPVAPDIATVNP